MNHTKFKVLRDKMPAESRQRVEERVQADIRDMDEAERQQALKEMTDLEKQQAAKLKALSEDMEKVKAFCVMLHDTIEEMKTGKKTATIHFKGGKR